MPFVSKDTEVSKFLSVRIVRLSASDRDRQKLPQLPQRSFRGSGIRVIQRKGLAIVEQQLTIELRAGEIRH